MEQTPWKLPSFYIHHGSSLLEHTPWKLQVEVTQWKLPHGT